MKLFKKKPVEKPKLQLSTPLCITIQNKSNAEQEFVLFGSCENIHKQNQGNPKDIEVTISGGFFNYQALLYDLLSENVKFGKIRLQSQQFKNIRQTLVHRVSDIFASTEESQELHMQIFMDAYQNQDSILEATIPIVINKRSSLIGKIQPESSLTVVLFPLVTGSLLNIDLNQDTPYLKRYALQRLSGANIPMAKVYQTPAWWFKMKNFWAKVKNVFKRKSK